MHKRRGRPYYPDYSRIYRHMKNNKWYFTVSSIVFTIIAVAHLARIVLMMEATINGYLVPLWVSGVAVIVAGYLATRGFLAAHRL